MYGECVREYNNASLTRSDCWTASRECGAPSTASRIRREGRMHSRHTGGRLVRYHPSGTSIECDEPAVCNRIEDSYRMLDNRKMKTSRMTVAWCLFHSLLSERCAACSSDHLTLHDAWCTKQYTPQGGTYEFNLLRHSFTLQSAEHVSFVRTRIMGLS